MSGRFSAEFLQGFPQLEISSPQTKRSRGRKLCPWPEEVLREGKGGVLQVTGVSPSAVNQGWLHSTERWQDFYEVAERYESQFVHVLA